MSDTQYIYSLSCPDKKVIVYIGITGNPKVRESAYRRLPNHNNKPLTKRDRWITDLLLSDKYPVFNIIELCNNQNASEREMFWINKYRTEFELLNQIVILDDSDYIKRINDKKEEIRLMKIKYASTISNYEASALKRLGQSIHEGKWSNEGLVQLIELSKDFLNPITLQEYANKNGLTYNGAKKRKIATELFGQKYIFDND